MELSSIIERLNQRIAKANIGVGPVSSDPDFYDYELGCAFVELVNSLPGEDEEELASYCQVWCMRSDSSSGNPANLSLINSVDELHAGNYIGHLLEPSEFAPALHTSGFYQSSHSVH